MSVQSIYNHTLRPVALQTFGRRLSVVNGVTMRRQAITDFSRVLELKKPMYNLIRDTVTPGDRVVDIASGRGGFAVKAAMNGATVDTYEAAENMVKWCRETVELNGMDDRVAIHHALISDTTAQLYGPVAGADSISPSELPTMDGLILDCEGAEIGIINGLTETNRPGYIIIETHPEADDPSPTATVIEALDKAGYYVEQQMCMDSPAKHALLAGRDAA